MTPPLGGFLGTARRGRPAFRLRGCAGFAPHRAPEATSRFGQPQGELGCRVIVQSILEQGDAHDRAGGVRASRSVGQTAPVQKIGLLAYGSLRWHPKGLREALDLAGAIVVETPFAIEFARTSKWRDGCPTLVPVESGGSQVAAALIPFREGISLPDAQTRVWRRELLRTSGTYDRTRHPSPNKVYVEPIEQPFADFDVVLSVSIGTNIDHLDGETLADFAIASARASAGDRREDGITYLIEAKKQGIETPLLPAYEDAVLHRLGVASLEEAWTAARSSSVKQLPSVDPEQCAGRHFTRTRWRSCATQVHSGRCRPSTQWLPR